MAQDDRSIRDAQGVGDVLLYEQHRNTAIGGRTNRQQQTLDDQRG
jgi:hypothetical protein